MSHLRHARTEIISSQTALESLSEFLPILRAESPLSERSVPAGQESCHKSLTPWGERGDAHGANKRWGQEGQIETMTTSKTGGVTRRGLLGAFAATAVVAAPTYANAFGFLRGSGDIRTLKMFSQRTGERLNTVYWIEGEYIPEAMTEINRLMRDWRTNQAINIDTRTIDILAASHRMLEADAPFQLLSGYRSAQTNSMLRSRSRSVARNSLHVKGQAADVRLDGRSVSQIARAAVACSAGGVGRYSRSNFVHVDCGDVRTWGR